MRDRLVSSGYQADIGETLVQHLHMRTLRTHQPALVFPGEKVLDEPGVPRELLFFGERLNKVAEEGESVVLFVWVGVSLQGTKVG